MTYTPICKFDIADVGFDVGAFDSGLLTDDETLSIVDSLIKKHLVKIRKIIIRVRGGSYESDIEIED